MSKTTHLRIYWEDYESIMNEYRKRKSKGETIDVADVVAERLSKARGGEDAE